MDMSHHVNPSAAHKEIWQFAEQTKQTCVMVSFKMISYDEKIFFGCMHKMTS
jgi:hypothetical protein